jgi:ectoine hydroxylase-related dioxygenase (phytanoyl-CoA dioxygenase family)
MPLLSSNQSSFFRRAGYLKLRGLVPKQLIEDVRSAIDEELIARKPPFKVNEAGDIYRLDSLYQRGETFKKLMTLAPLLDSVESLVGPNIELTLNRHNHLAVNAPGETIDRLHRDVLQWTRCIVTAIFYLEDAAPANGCTLILPTSQYLPFVGTPNNGGTWMDEHSVFNDLAEQAVPIHAEKGDILLFDSLAFHTTGKNNSRLTRMSIAAGYHSVDELDGIQQHEKRVLVRGQRIYRGNDRK